MSNVFFIADTHFGHQAIIRFESKYRPFETIQEHDNELVRRWNQRIGKKDIVWHLGDVAWTEDALYEYLPQLNGRIKLVMGNHDTFPASLYLKLGIESLHGCVAWKRGSLLTHMPTVVGDSERFELNIHGHTHSHGAPTSQHYCVSAEWTDLAPICHEALPTRNQQ